MKKLFVWIMVCAVFLTGVYALAQSGTQPTPQAGSDQVGSLQYGDDGDAVARLQTKLFELKYYNGKISGLYREGTQAAISKFQKEFALEVTGVADAQTQELLFATQYRPLQKGDSGDAVKALQNRLTELGYYNGKISGNYLEGTYYATHSFQQVNGLSVTGMADAATQTLLFDTEKALPKDASAATPAPQVTPVPTLAVVEEAGGEGPVVLSGETTPAPAAATEIPFSKKLQRGSTGSGVKQLQTRLTELGFYKGPVSGNYMNQTRDAVRAFQEHNALTVDGITGQETWDMIFNNDQVSDASATPKPTPAPTPIPYAITVDVANQVVTVYGLDENGGHTNVVRQMICSTGTKANPSDVGDWTLNGSTARWAYFPKWGSNAQYWTRINKSIAFHSVIYNSTNTMDLATGSYSALGSRASHGCIRLTVSDAKWVYDNVGKGTVVTITEKLPADPELAQSLKPAPLDRSRMLPKPTAAPTPAPAYDSQKEPPAPFRNLQKGDKGEDVYWLQMKLTELGYYKGTVTGGYYGGTQAAVKAFQKANGLTADGVAGSKTQSVIYGDVLNSPAPVATPTPKPANNPQ